MVLTPENESNNHPHPIRIKVAGYNAQRLGLNYIPNIKIMECTIPGISQKCHINLYFIGTKYSSKSSYFTDIAVKAITLLLNTARNSLLREAVELRDNGSLDNVDAESLFMMPPFESKTGGNQDLFMKNKKFIMSQKQAYSFANKVDNSLKKYVSDITFKTFKENTLGDPLMTGCIDFPKTIQDSEMKEMFGFLQSLAKGVFYTVNCAGFKEDYHCQSDFRTNLEWETTYDARYNQYELLLWMNETSDLILKDFFGKLFANAPLTDAANNGYDHVPQNLPFKFHVDIGLKSYPQKDHPFCLS